MSAPRAHRDSYRLAARLYDLLEPINRGLRLAGMRMFRPDGGMRILDAGCGTGTHLDLYRRYTCTLHGLDLSPAMLAAARRRAGGRVQLTCARANGMPFPSGAFDLVLSMLMLHEMEPTDREATLGEIRRVLKADGRVLLIDFAPGRYEVPRGWFARILIVALELAAGGRHFANHRRFLAAGGLPALLERHRFDIQKTKLLAGGTLGLYLASPGP